MVKLSSKIVAGFTFWFFLFTDIRSRNILTVTSSFSLFSLPSLSLIALPFSLFPSFSRMRMFHSMERRIVERLFLVTFWTRFELDLFQYNFLFLSLHFSNFLSLFSPFHFLPKFLPRLILFFRDMFILRIRSFFSIFSF